MKIKKILPILLVVAILIGNFYWINQVSFAAGSTNPETVATKYFYNQLSTDGKAFYNVLEEMYEAGELQQGNVSKEITSETISNLDTKLEEYTKGSQDLLNTMGAAKDAFSVDHPDLFYIDYDYISLRVTLKEGQKHLFLGTGRGDHYINKEFLNEDGKTINTDKINTAKTAIENNVNSIVEKVEAVEENLKPGQDLVEQQVKVAHNEIIKLAKYTYEFQTDHPYTVRNIYGAFGLGTTSNSGNVVCEGFARALKTVLDKVGIPCLLVRGVYRVTANQPEEHMWNYVQLSDGKWYAVDCTYDNKDEFEGGEEVISTKYFLVGQDVMFKHVPTGILSTSNYEFKYPTLENVSDKFDVVVDTGLLKVEMDDERFDALDGVEAAIFRISYNGHGYKKAMEEDKVAIVVKFYQEYLDGTTAESPWSYPVTELYDHGTEASGIHDTDTYIQFIMPHIPYFQVAVTDLLPLPYHNSGDVNEIVKMTTYLGDDTSLLEKTDTIVNPNGNYIAPPYVLKATPAVNTTQFIGTTMNVTVEYDDILIPKEGEEEVSVDVMILDPVTGEYRDASDKITVGDKSDERLKYKITNFNFDGVSTFTFDFTPSEMWADDSVYYMFKFNGLMGSRSHKEPMGVSYGCSHGCEVYAFQSQGFNMNVYGKPLLMDDMNVDDLNLEGMTDEDKQRLSDVIKNRLTLVTTTTTKADNDVMTDKLDNYLEEHKGDGEAPEVYETQTYNINLTLCPRMKAELKDGTSLRVMLGFPAGYGPDDEGVTFKAYHYVKDSNGNITGIEEIPCTITKLGLVLEVSSFSPFTIAAIEKTEADSANTDKTVMLNLTEGGKVQNVDKESAEADRMNTLKTGETLNLKVVADEGYEIDEIMVGDQAETLGDSDKTEKTIEIQYSELAEDPTTMLKVSFATTKTHEDEKADGQTVVTQPIVNNATFAMSSKAYKEVQNDDDEGSIKSEVTSLNLNDEFEVEYSVSEVSNIGTGFNTIGGKIEYDNTKLQLIGLEKIAQDAKWGVTFESQTNKFIATTSDNNLSKETEKIFKAKFKVIDGKNASTNITLTELSAGTGSTGDLAIAKASDVTTVLNIVEIVKEELTLKENAAEKYISIKDSFVEMPDGIKFSELENYITTSESHKFHTNIEAEGDQPAKQEQIEGNADILIQTGDTITVGSKVWTFVVKGDLNGDGNVDLTDISYAKLHFVGTQTLAGAYLEAGETDGDGEYCTVNDISRLKLKYIDELENFFADLEN